MMAFEVIFSVNLWCEIFKF